MERGAYYECLDCGAKISAHMVEPKVAGEVPGGEGASIWIEVRPASVLCTNPKHSKTGIKQMRRMSGD